MKRILYISVFIFAMAMLLCFSALAVNTTYTDEDGVTWSASVDLTNNKAEITGVTTPQKVENGAIVNLRTEKVVIPSVVVYQEKEYPVTSIGNNAFKGKNLLFGKLTLPETLETIGEYAFSQTNIYGDIVLPESLTAIRKYAFSECKGILTVTLPSSMKRIPEGAFYKCFSLTSVYSNGVIERFDLNCFNTCTALHDVQIGIGTSIIGEGAFSTCRGLDGTLDLSTVASISKNAFNGCFNITAVKLPTNIAVDFAIFSGCNKIASYEVSSESQSYTTVDGVLYNKAMTILYRYPIEKTDMEFKLPDTVVEISPDAFANAYHLGDVKLNKVIATIGNNAFKNTGISSMFIPDSVTTIGTLVLDNCDYLEWVVVSKNISTASGLVSNCDNIKLVIGRNESFATANTGNSSVSYKASDYTCTNHIYGYLDDTASCTESGINTCIICDRSSYVKPTGHEGAIVGRGELTCTTDSYILVDCVKCGVSAAKTVFEKATGHVSTPKTEKPTDTKPGYTVETCSVCNETIISNYVASFYLIGDVNDDGKINATDAEYLADYIGKKSFNVNKLTCDINGDYQVDIYDLILLRRYVANIDSEIKSTAQGCKKHLHIGSMIASESSCTNDGIEIFYCLDCGTPIQTKTTEKKGHAWEYFSTIEATCANSGFSSVRCTTCGITTVLNYDKLPHTPSWWTLPNKKGYEYSECLVCGAFEHNVVDYSEFDDLIKQLPQYYEMYFSPNTLSILNPILENYKLALTQEQVDKNVEDFKYCMSKIQYNVTDVPVIYINSIGDFKLQSSTQSYTPTVDAEIIVAYRDENGVYNDYIETSGSAKVRGNSTANPSKKPYNIKFSTEVDLFGMGKDNKYCLLANAYESTLMRNALVRYFNDVSGLDFAGKYEFVDVYVDGSYRGNYLLCTPIDIEDTRIDIDKKTDAVLEVETSFSEGDFYINGSGSLTTTPFFSIRFQVADGNDLNGEGYSKVFSTLYQLEYAIMSGDWEEIQKYADVDSLVRYYILVDYFKDVDFNWDSTRFYVQDGKLHGGPAWDYDRAAGHVQRGSYRGNYNNMPDFTNGIFGDSATGEWANSSFLGYPNENWQYTLSSKDWVSTSDGSSHNNHTWLTYLYQLSPNFQDMLSQYVFDLKDEMTIMYADTVDELGKISTNAIDEIYNNDDIYASFSRDVLLWGIPMKGDEKPRTYNSHKEAVEDLRKWLMQRHQWMINHYSNEKLAQYCAELADDMIRSDFGDEITTSFITLDGECTYIVNVPISSESAIGSVEKKLYNQVYGIFKDNLCYASVVVNLTMNGEVVEGGTYSTADVLAETKSLVEAELLKTVNNKYASNTTVTFEEVDGVLTANVKVNISVNDHADQQKLLFELIKKHFNNANIYVSVDISYTSNNSVYARYINDLKK